MKKRILSMIVAVVTLLSVWSFGPVAQAATWTTTEEGYKVYNYAKNAVGTFEMPRTGLCQAFVRICLEESIGMRNSRGGCCAMKAGQTNIISTSRDDIPLGAAVYFAGSKITCSQCGQKAGHVGIYIGNNEIAHSWGSNKVITKSTIDYVINCGYTYCGWGWQGGYALATSSDEFAATIQPGLYALAPACAPDRRLDVKGESLTGWMDAKIWRSNDTTTQQWNIEPMGNGYYKLTVKATGKVLDVANAQTASGTNVQQCIWTDNAAQYWRFTDAGDGYYHITTRLNSNMRLDVNEGTDADGANVQIWEANDSSAQKWKLIPVQPREESSAAGQASVTGQEIVDYAKKWIGTPYVWGGTSLTDGADCSGFVCRVYEHFGFNLWGRRTGLRRLADDGAAIELGTDLSLAQPGDIITCNDGKHVVIYAGNGRVVQSSSNHGVCESPATQAWLGNVISIIRMNGVSNTATSEPEPDSGASTAPTETKTQYRYHRYTDSRGNVALCPYWGNDRYKTTMHIEYTDWLDAPLTREEGLRHVYWGSDCANAGCVDASGITFRCRDASGGAWYYEETRNVEVAAEAAPEPEPEPNCDNGHTWGAWTVVLEAGCGKTGREERTCAVCHEVETRTIAALRHDYQVTRSDDRQVVYTCSNCGDSYTAEKEQERPSTGTLPLPFIESYSDDLFWDVERGDWFYPNVTTAYELGLMRGTGEGTFSPADHTTLAEAVTLAARIHSLYYTGAENFRGYDGGNWYDPYVNYARENRIISANYNYSKPATREEFVHILARALPEEELANVAGTIFFADDNAITYMGDVELLSGAGIINGIPENDQIYFKPTATITRAEVAAIVGRMAQPNTRVGW